MRNTHLARTLALRAKLNDEVEVGRQVHQRRAAEKRRIHKLSFDQVIRELTTELIAVEPDPKWRDFLKTNILDELDKL